MPEFIKKFFEDKKKALWLLPVLILMAVILFLTVSRSGERFVIDNPDKSVSTAAYKPETPLLPTAPFEGIKVYVVGCVYNPGVVDLKKGQIIEDAIKAAGGTTKDADTESINLAYKLNDNLMIRIRSKQESKAGEKSALVSDSGGAVVEASGAKKSENYRININSATVDELDTLPGVGKATADKIISYRASNGNFKAVEDLMKVAGIGKSKFEQLKDLVAVN